MITDALLGVLNTVLSWMLALRPEWNMSLPGEVDDVISMVMSYDSILPVHEVLAIIAVVSGFVVVMQTWKWTVKFVDWIAAVIP